MALSTKKIVAPARTHQGARANHPPIQKTCREMGFLGYWIGAIGLFSFKCSIKKQFSNLLRL